MKKFLFSCLALLISVIIFAILGEIVIRLFLKERFRIVADERNLTYKYHEELGWVPLANNQKYFTGGRRIFVQHNNRGFRDHEHGIKDKPRIVFLGDSFVWGYDVEQYQRFTEKLQKLIPAWEVINLGISGYGTDQEYLLIQKHFEYYKPEIVCLIFCQDNDEEDNMSNFRYGYFKPYFTIEEGNLTVKGIPVTKSWNYHYIKYPTIFKSYLLRALVKVFLYSTHSRVSVPNPTKRIITAMKNFVTSHGSLFIMGFQDDNNVLQDFCQEHNILQLRLKNPYRYPDEGAHWTPKGHTYISKKIYEFLTENTIISENQVDTLNVE